MVAIKIARTYPIRVNYTRNFQEIIKIGQYGQIHPFYMSEKVVVITDGVTHNSEYTDAKQIKLELVQFNSLPLPPESILKELEKIGCRPAVFEELLAFSEKYPEVREVVAFGSKILGPKQEAAYPYITTTTNSGKRQYLSLYMTTDDPRYFLVAAVRI